MEVKLIPVWILWCFVSDDDLVNDDPHVAQINGFNPLWVLMCDVNPDLKTNRLGHRLQE